MSGLKGKKKAFSCFKMSSVRTSMGKGRKGDYENGKRRTIAATFLKDPLVTFHEAVNKIGERVPALGTALCSALLCFALLCSARKKIYAIGELPSTMLYTILYSQLYCTVLYYTQATSFSSIGRKCGC
ncbi:hypothetical protein M0802_008830 [Mischocyttarus mexicanus]|nr:hypothetical protein M0802_008830 [Mischocyttarus mexicanus]